MDTLIEGLLASVKLGAPVRQGSLTLLPVFAELPLGPDYLSLTEAVDSGVLAVTEVNEGGSVPELVAENAGTRPVLIVDGEELAGAKQNRVLNTTVLIAANTKVVIPVSCVEQGRWYHVSSRFGVSRHHSAHNVRARTYETVTGSLRATGFYRSDQGRVWQEVAKISEEADVQSPTFAMHDVYEERKADIDEFSAGMPLLDGQNGLAVARDGRVIGIDVVSRPGVYGQLHDQLVRSYVFESWHEKRDCDIAADEKAAKIFIAELGDAAASSHESPGAGISYRYTAPGVVGSALVCDDALLHAAFFAIDGEFAGPRTATPGG